MTVLLGVWQLSFLLAFVVGMDLEEENSGWREDQRRILLRVPGCNDIGYPTYSYLDCENGLSYFGSTFISCFSQSTESNELDGPGISEHAPFSGLVYVPLS